MRAQFLKLFAPVLLFVLLLGVSSTASADALVISSITFSNFQFTPTAGTAVVTPTTTFAQAISSNSLGENQQDVSNTFPIAQAAASTTFSTASAGTSATDGVLTAFAMSNIGGCNCSTGSFGQSILTGTLVILGGEGSVDVTFSGLLETLRQAQTDAFSIAEADFTYDFRVNNNILFEADGIRPVGPNETLFILGADQLSRTITLQYGAVNTFDFRVAVAPLAVNEVPEPASMVLLVSGLGAMTGIIKSRKRAK